MSKISIRKSIEVIYYMEVDDIEYRTDGHGNWERSYVNSWEAEYSREKELEELFKQNLNQNKDESD
jgi:hypothetical protein